MKRLKLIISWVIIGFLVALEAGYVIRTSEAWATRPYKLAFVEFQRASYREAMFISMQKEVAEGHRKLESSKKTLRQVQDSLALAEESTYKALCEFPEKYQEYAVAASHIHEQTLNLRKYRASGFKKTDEEPFTEYDVVLDSIRDIYYDCSIIQKVESKRLLNNIF